jgi:hypothetical protein
MIGHVAAASKDRSHSNSDTPPIGGLGSSFPEKYHVAHACNPVFPLRLKGEGRDHFRKKKKKKTNR